MMTEKEHLECEIKELELVIKDKAKAIGKLKTYLEQKEQQLKEMNDAQRNTNEAVENKQNELINKLQNNNWSVAISNAHYQLLEVVDENTVKIEGVKYKKVEKEKPPTLYDALELPYLTNGYMFNKQQKEWICEIVKEWLPPEVIEDGEEYHNGWNDCLKLMRLNLK